MSFDARNLQIREEITPRDRNTIFKLLTSSGHFLPREMAYGMDLFDEHLLKGEMSQYQFMLYEQGTMLMAYGCYGAIRLSEGRFHLHWLAVDRAYVHQGLGRQLEAAMTAKIRSLGGSIIFAEVSNRDYHTTARAFYGSLGYRPAVTIPDYYGDHDDMLLYRKDL